MSGTIVVYLVAVLFFLFGFYKIYQVVKQSRRISASASWPTVAADVLRKEVRTHRRAKGGESYTPEVAYRYAVLGTEYNQTVSLSGLWSRNSAQKALDQIGGAIEVRYNPENPKENCHPYDKVGVLDYLTIVGALALGALLIVLQVI